MRWTKLLLMTALIASIGGVTLTGCVSNRHQDRTEDRIDTRDHRHDSRRD